MATLNLSINGASISNSYKSVLDSSPPTGAPAASRTYGQWALFSVTAPLVSAFQQGAGKESTLKVESTGEGELQDLIDEFSDGRIQFAFVKVKDANTGLFKNALIGWCGEGVPERTKGYFSSHQAAVEKLLHGYHVQISARSESDLTPDGIVQKIADASGAKYSITDRTTQVSNAPPQPPPKKAVFTPVSGTNSGSSFNPLAARLARSSRPQDLDNDGWGADAPPVTRTQLETVKSAYIPTKVDMRQLANQPSQSPRAVPDEGLETSADVVKGGYKPVGKVDIAAIRKQAAESGNTRDERPSPVKGAYEPVGKVDIAAIRAKAQPAANFSPVGSSASRPSNEDHEATLGQSSITANTGRLEQLPRPKVANRFGSGSGAFGATKAPVPGQFGLSSGAPGSNAETVNTSRTFADSAGKTPAQLWAEKKAASNGGTVIPPTQDVKTVSAQSPGWKSGYEGKKWATVQTTRTGNSVTSDDQQAADSESEQRQAEDSRDLSSIRARFSQEPPPLNTLNATGTSDTGVHLSSYEPSFKTEAPVEDLSARVVPPPLIPRTPSPDVDAADESSPVRIAMPVARGAGVPIQDAHNEQHSPPPILPSNALAQHAALQPGADEEPEAGHDTAREVAESVATAAFAEHQDETKQATSSAGNKRALAQYDYEKAEDNELELREGDEITNIDMIDTDWWMGQNPRGETGLFPSNYVEIIEEAGSGEAAINAHEAAPSHGNIATAQYDYEAAEDNELSFPERAKITNVEFPDDDWWSGEYNGVQGLFPANYVELDS